VPAASPAGQIAWRIFTETANPEQQKRVRHLQDAANTALPEISA
jgi:hypothetical protein